MMSDLRCPMCGKTNSGDQDSCKYCQARLKPLVVGSDKGESLPEPGLFEAEEPGMPPDQSMDSSSDLPAWLKSLRSETPAETGSEALPDWMADTGTPEAESMSEEDIPDWLRSLRGESNKGEEQLFDEGDTEIEPAHQDIPDWLAGMRANSSEGLEEHDPGDEPAAQFGEAEQEWLHRIDSQPASGITSQQQASVPFEEESQDKPVSPTEVSAPQDGTDSVPEWLAGLSVASMSANVLEISNAPSAADEPALATEEPSIAQVIQPAVIGGSIEAFVQDEPASVKEEINPDWLDDLVEAKPEPSVAIEETAIPAVEVPDWLSGYDETALSEGSLLSTTGDNADRLNLDWLEDERQALGTAAEQNMPGAVTPEAELSPFLVEPASQPFFSGELPEWLGEDSEKAVIGAAAITPGEKGEDLAHADLPSWLESMRPIESADLPAPVVESSDKQVEGTGPLAGLRSVLPSEFELGGRSAPAAYTVKLQVSDTQKTHASIIDDLIKSEGEAGELPGRRTLGPQQLLLIGIFAILLVALLWPLLSGSQSVELPYFSTEAFEASSAIGNLPATAPVLLAVDYEPGLSGEMEATASAVLDHLMLKGTYLALVSTAPSGPAQAERLVQGVNTRGEHAYQSADMYANLGYLPGGTVGIRSFAESPRQVMPFSLDGAAVWNAGPLASIQKLSDFAMVLVITESPYTARSWIEQVKPLLGEKPLVMVVSAQVEPVERPYFDGEPRVVQGFVAGLPGGAAYENMLGRSNLARKYWDAYSIGISLIAILLVVGVVVNIILHFTARRQQAAGGAKL